MTKTPAEVLKDERAKAAREKHEKKFAQQLRAEYGPITAANKPGSNPFKREFVFSDAGWRFDFAAPCYFLALEIEGGIWTGGRHVRGYGFIEDMRKYNHAVMLGWHLLRFSPDMVKSGEALQYVLDFIKQRLAVANLGAACD